MNTWKSVSSWLLARVCKELHGQQNIKKNSLQVPLLNTPILLAWWVAVTRAHHSPLEVQCLPNNSRIILHSTARCLLHPIQTHEYLEALFINCRLGIWLSLLSSKRIPLTARSYWINLPNHRPTTTNNATLLIKSSHRIRIIPGYW